jgi:hypothetical protein
MFLVEYTNVIETDDASASKVSDIPLEHKKSPYFPEFVILLLLIALISLIFVGIRRKMFLIDSPPTSTTGSRYQPIL